MNQFLRFLVLSGLGWLCDFATFALLSQGFGMSPFAANVVSSYVGVTFVWFTSLKTVFYRSGSRQALAMYWTYQLVSIMAYSQLLQAVAGALAGVLATTDLPVALRSAGGLAAKILVTPLNLISNFLFMKFLTRSMRPR
ncbi:GtrA family protein [Pseudoduganella sp. SL102]|uniref:GtrA family protein n=1 Tax=Pseudoduganella sp. SL102 TaxID=2995154 RepID=UPI00248AC53D|nr:GtrA family protein [Pseudoduganella sp. SL102]WBS02042.1 GtrA family protein [Pseudoduganella sp. SL102]